MASESAFFGLALTGVTNNVHARINNEKQILEMFDQQNTENSS